MKEEISSVCDYRLDNHPLEGYGIGSERNKTETIFSVIKSIRGKVSELQDERERAVAQSACL